MSKRVIAAFLWAISIYSGWELGWGLFGIPREVGPILALAVAAIVLVDPGHFIWDTGPSRRVAQIPEAKGSGQAASLRR